MTAATCENCGQPAELLTPCPCGLGDECPVTDGVCARCRSTIVRNVRQRASDKAEPWGPVAGGTKATP